MDIYKQKYEQALENIKKIKKANKDNKELVDFIEYQYPELKESEVEKMRNFISHELVCLRATDEQGSDRYKELTEAITWLEKQNEHQQFLNKIQVGDELTKNERGHLVNLSQLKRIAKPRNKQKGEQKPINKVEPKFKVGDIIINEYGFIMQIDGIDGNMYGYHVLGGNILLKHDITKTDESCHLWTIQDAKDGDVLATHLSPEGDWIGMCKESTGDTFKTHCYLNAVGEFVINPNRCKNHGTHGLHPATKEQCDLLFQKIKEAGYEWDGEKKELKKIEQKITEWSEEDERILDSIIEEIMPCGDCPDYPTDEEREYFYNGNRKVELLKSLKQRMKEAGYEWDAEKKELKKIEHKPDWSKEDERRMQQIISDLEQCTVPGFPIYIGGIELEINWLKSLKERMKGE